MKIGVIGAGTVGLTIAIKAGMAGNKVFLFDLNQYAIDEIRGSELEIGGKLDDRHTLDHVYSEIEPFLANEMDVICIATKTPSLESVLKSLKEHGVREKPIISCQNGLGNEDLIAAYFGAEWAFRMVINYAGSLLSSTVIHISFFHPPNYVSSVHESGREFARQFAQMLTDAHLETEFTPNIKGYVYRKVILNCALSGICALTRLNMYEAMNEKEIVDIVKNLLLEGMKVAHLESANLGDDYFTNGMEYLKNAGRHKPSMLMDIENGQATEIDSLNHQLLKLARQHGIHIPFMRTITTLVRGLDQAVCTPKKINLI